MNDEKLLQMIDTTAKFVENAYGDNGYVSHYVVNNKLVIRFENERTHEVAVVKWRLVKVND